MTDGQGQEGFVHSIIYQSYHSILLVLMAIDELVMPYFQIRCMATHHCRHMMWSRYC